jgi:hypothetical protein
LDGAGQEPQGKDEPIGDLVGRLIADGRAYAETELALVKSVARHRMKRARKGAILVGIGIALLFSALTALILGIVLALAQLINPALAGLIVFAALAVIGGLLAKVGGGDLAALGGDPEEREAIERGKVQP